jgi:hypothetical protein
LPLHQVAVRSLHVGCGAFTVANSALQRKLSLIFVKTRFPRLSLSLSLSLSLTHTHTHTHTHSQTSQTRTHSPLRTHAHTRTCTHIHARTCTPTRAHSPLQLYRRGVNSFAAFCMRVVLWASAIPPDAMPEQLAIIHGQKDELSPLATTPALPPITLSHPGVAGVPDSHTEEEEESAAAAGHQVGSGASGSSPRTRSSQDKLALGDANVTYTDIDRLQAGSTFSRRANATVWHPPARSDAAGEAAGNQSADPARVPAEPRLMVVHDSADKYVTVEQSKTRAAPRVVDDSRVAAAAAPVVSFDGKHTAAGALTADAGARLYTHNVPSYTHARASMSHSISSMEIAAITALAAAATEKPPQAPVALVSFSARTEASIEPSSTKATPARTHSVSLSPIVVLYEQAEEGTQTDRASLILPILRTLRNGRPAVDCECQTDASARYPPLHTVLRRPDVSTDTASAAVAPTDAAISAAVPSAVDVAVAKSAPAAAIDPSSTSTSVPPIAPANTPTLVRVPSAAAAAALSALKSTRPAPAAPSSPLRTIAAPVLAGSATPPESATPGMPLGESVAARRALFSNGRPPLLATRSEATLDIPMHAALVTETALAAAGLASASKGQLGVQRSPDATSYDKPPPRNQKSTPTLTPGLSSGP